MINFFTGFLRKIDKELWARDTEGRQMGLNPYSQSVQPSRSSLLFMMRRMTRMMMVTAYFCVCVCDHLVCWALFSVFSMHHFRESS